SSLTPRPECPTETLRRFRAGWHFSRATPSVCSAHGAAPDGRGGGGGRERRRDPPHQAGTTAGGGALVAARRPGRVGRGAHGRPPQGGRGGDGPPGRGWPSRRSGGAHPW